MRSDNIAHGCLAALPPLTPDSNIGEFPVRDDIELNESGHGYVLRMAVANYLGGVPAVKKMLGKTRFAVLEDTDAMQICRWFGADPEKLKRALGATGIGRTASDFEICGQPIGRSYFINRMHPRVCSLCLAQAPHCKSQWELSLSTACHLHSVSLIESCPLCGGNLSWNRPSVTTCKCGGSLSSMSLGGGCNALECALSRWIVEKLSSVGEVCEFELPPNREDGTFDSALIRFLQPLTLCGGMQLIYALGTAERCDTSSSYSSRRKKSSIAFARDMLFQADTMVEKLIASKSVDFRKSSLSVVINLLAESAKASADAADRSLAHSLIYILLRQGGRSNWKSRHPQLSQYELF